MKKVVINRCYGGFSVSKAVYDELGFKWEGYGYIYNEMLGIEDNIENRHEYRTHPKLIEAIEKIGVEKASGTNAKLSITYIPDDVEWEISDYDGIETIHETHRTWY